MRDHDLSGPFDEFIRRATQALNTPNVVRGAPNDIEYVRVIEERRYVIDIRDRVEMLAFAYSRLGVLSDLYRESSGLIEAARHAVKEESLTWEVPDEIFWQRDLRFLEARVLVSFVYYELTSLANMLKAHQIRIPAGELAYLLKARDKFLAHPAWHGRVRNAHGSVYIPQQGPLHAFAICADETDPVLIDFYRRSCLGRSDVDYAEQARLRNLNENLILSGKRNRDFLPDELMCLKAFGIREPDLEASIEEMATLLRTLALPEIERISAQPIPSQR